MSRHFSPDWVVAPGETLLEWIVENETTMSELAEKAGLKDFEIRGLVSGLTELTGARAEALATATGVPASFWTAAERLYREGMAAGRIVTGVVPPGQPDPDDAEAVRRHAAHWLGFANRQLQLLIEDPTAHHFLGTGYITHATALGHAYAALAAAVPPSTTVGKDTDR